MVGLGSLFLPDISVIWMWRIWRDFCHGYARRKCLEDGQSSVVGGDKER